MIGIPTSTVGKPQVEVIATGGTISCKEKKNGKKAPGLGIEKILKHAPSLFEKFEISPVPLMHLDSTLVGYPEWVRIAESTKRALDADKSVMITHGTDTMAYTGAALSFMLRGMKAPVVMTGAMHSITKPPEEGGDATMNLELAGAFLEMKIPGVYIAFNQKIFKATRATKIDSVGINAFDGPDRDYVATMKDGKLDLNPNFRPVISEPQLVLDTVFDTRVVRRAITPSQPVAEISILPKIGVRGAVMELFGEGGIPYLTKMQRLARSVSRSERAPADDIVGAVKQVAQQIPIVVVSQSLHGGVDLSKYSAYEKVIESGVIPGGDMTPEAATVKLMWCLGKQYETGNIDIGRIRKQFRVSYAGEITRTGGGKDKGGEVVIREYQKQDETT